jgi:hypothetical protein
MAVTAAGALYAWGDGHMGQLGTGDAQNRPAPALVCTALGKSPVLMVACGGTRSLAVTRAGTVWTFGAPHSIACGAPARPGMLRAKKMPPKHFGSRPIVSVSTTSQHSIAVDDDGRVYTWGQALFRDDYELLNEGASPSPGGLGHPDLKNKAVPTEIERERLQGLRIGCCRPLPQDHALAFLMGTHARLGATAHDTDTPTDKAPGNTTALQNLSSDLARGIALAAAEWPAGPARNLDGLVRLLGGGMMPRR